MAEDLELKVKILESRINDIADQLSKALRYIQDDPEGSLGKSRTILEKILLDVYKIEMGGEPKKPEIGGMLNDNQFTRKVQRNIVSRMNAIRDMANLGVHGEPVNDRDARDVLDNLCVVIDWYIDNYREKKSAEQSAESEKRLIIKQIDETLSKTEIVRIIEDRIRFAIQLNANQRAKSKILKARIDQKVSHEEDGRFIFIGTFTAENPLKFLFNYPFNYTGKFRGETYDCKKYHIRELSFSSMWEKIKGISWVDVRQELIEQVNR